MASKVKYCPNCKVSVTLDTCIECGHRFTTDEVTPNGELYWKPRVRKDLDKYNRARLLEGRNNDNQKS
jgi:predicted RNA-binding protein with PUA domain